MAGGAGIAYGYQQHDQLTRTASMQSKGEVDTTSVDPEIQKLFIGNNIKDNVSLEQIMGKINKDERDINTINLLNKAKNQVVVRDTLNSYSKNKGNLLKNDIGYLQEMMTNLQKTDMGYFESKVKVYNGIVNEATNNQKYYDSAMALVKAKAKGNANLDTVGKLISETNSNVKGTTLKNNIISILTALRSTSSSVNSNASIQAKVRANNSGATTNTNTTTQVNKESSSKATTIDAPTNEGTTDDSMVEVSDPE